MKSRHLGKSAKEIADEAIGLGLWPYGTPRGGEDWYENCQRVVYRVIEEMTHTVPEVGSGS